MFFSLPSDSAASCVQNGHRSTGVPWWSGAVGQRLASRRWRIIAGNFGAGEHDSWAISEKS
jgi:hypothetical protein